MSDTPLRRPRKPLPATSVAVAVAAALLLLWVLVPRLAAQEPGASAKGTIQGTPWRGARGITESVEAIMARQRVRDRLVGPPYFMNKPELRLPEKTVVDPDALAVSQWPPPTA